jgi:LexA-binding, inner membrane-associated putative hydrolase
MSPATHFLTGWVLANCARLDRRDRAIVTIAAVVPDVDGLGIIPEILTRNASHPLLWFSAYHHSLHTLLFATVVSLGAFGFSTSGWKASLLAFLSFHIHLAEDLIGSRGPDGYRWPIPYLKPFSKHLELVWQGQWSLNAWQNYLITLALITATLWIARTRGVSPVDIFSSGADKPVINAIRGRA